MVHLSDQEVDHVIIRDSEQDRADIAALERGDP